MSTEIVHGLSEREAAARRARGEGNRLRTAGGRSYAAIVRDNLLTAVNIALIAIGAALVGLGLYSDALVSTGLVGLNIAIGMTQEVRAKRRLDRIALLARPTATVMRDDEERTIDPDEIVRGDVLLARAGDQIHADGPVIGGRLEVDEALLTGEADRVVKRPGDLLYAGSFCVAGSGVYEAERVGANRLASGIAAGARAHRRVLTPLQTDVNFVLRLLLLLAGFFGLMLVLAAAVNDFPLADAVLAGAVIAGLVPPGLFLMIAVSYALGAARLGRQGALVQQANAIESLSHVDVLCLDKTGTLTANRLTLTELQPLGVAEETLRDALGAFAASVASGNRTTEALAAALGGAPRAVAEEIPFDASRKWSALTFAANENPADAAELYVLGAPEALLDRLAPGSAAPLRPIIDAWSARGLRVLLFAAHPTRGSLRDAADAPRLPPALAPLGLVGVADELRPDAQRALAGFVAAGIVPKLISGDNPETVAALARRAGLEPGPRLVSGPELAEMDEATFRRTAEEATIFGRVAPDQKERLVAALRANGHYVAMVGDGVNDILALKQAQLGIAMASGSQAARAVADLILLNDSFAALPPALIEGQRIRAGMKVVLRLFLTRVVMVATVLLAVVLIGAGFPFSPKQIALLSSLTVGLPAFAVAAWARPTPAAARGLPRGVVDFVVPAALLLAATVLGVYLAVYLTTRDSVEPLAPLFADRDVVIAVNRQAMEAARNAATMAAILGGLLLIPFAQPPGRRGIGGGDRRPALLALALGAVYAAIVAAPPARAFFGLALPTLPVVALVGVAVVGWTVALRAAWRRRLFARLMRPAVAPVRSISPLDSVIGPINHEAASRRVAVGHGQASSDLAVSPPFRIDAVAEVEGNVTFAS